MAKKIKCCSESIKQKVTTSPITVNGIKKKKKKKKSQSEKILENVGDASNISELISFIFAFFLPFFGDNRIKNCYQNILHVTETAKKLTDCEMCGNVCSFCTRCASAMRKDETSIERLTACNYGKIELCRHNTHTDDLLLFDFRIHFASNVCVKI